MWGISTLVNFARGNCRPQPPIGKQIINSALFGRIFGLARGLPRIATTKVACHSEASSPFLTDQGLNGREGIHCAIEISRNELGNARQGLELHPHYREEIISCGGLN